MFNVSDYGAVADGKTDNTEAFSSCLDAILDAGGGQMLIPAGVYRGRISIPPVSRNLPSWLTIEIVGELEPTPVFGTIGSFPLQNRGTIIKCLDGSGPAVIFASASEDALYGRFSGVNVVLRNLDVRTCDDPPINGIDLEYALQCRIENVFVNTGVYSVQAGRPVHGTAGIITPRCNNAALTVLRNVVITGYHTGVVVNEHTDADNINLACCYNGLEFVRAHHASRFGRVGAQRCTRNIAVSGAHAFSIDQLDMEISGQGQHDAHNEWQCTDCNLYDPGNLGTGDINYWVVEGGVGAVETFSKVGGKGVQTRRIGHVL